MCDMYSYQKVSVDVIPLCFFDEASPCPLHDVYEVLVIICCLPQGVVHPNSAFIDLDNKKDPVESVSYTYMYKKCLIYIHIYTIKLKKR